MVRGRVRVLDTDHVELTVDGVAHIRDSLGSRYDRRAATEAEATPTDRLGVKLGYVLRNHTLPGLAFGSDHHLVTGVTYPIVQRAVSVGATTLHERHAGWPDAPDLTCYRQQFDVERLRVRVSPWLHQSLALQHEGFIRSGSRFGLRWRFASGHSVKGVCQFESIEAGTAWRPRHAIYSEWAYDPAGRERASQELATQSSRPALPAGGTTYRNQPLDSGLPVLSEKTLPLALLSATRASRITIG